MPQHENRYYVRNAWIFLHQMLLICLSQCVVSCYIYLMYVKLTETQQERISQLNKTNGSASTAQISLTRTLAAKQPRHSKSPRPPRVGSHMLEKFRELKPKPQNVTELKASLQTGTICLMKQFANLLWAFANDLRHASKLKADIRTYRLIYLVPIIVHWLIKLMQHFSICFSALQIYVKLDTLSR